MEVKPMPGEISSLNDKKVRQPLKVFPQTTDNKVENGKRVAVEFEALYVELMLKSMRGEGRGDSMTGGGKAGETYRALLDQEYARIVAANGALGLGANIEKELVRLNVTEGQPTRQFPRKTAEEKGKGNSNENR